MNRRHRKVLAAVAVFVGVAQAGATETDRHYSFGNWKIDRIENNRSYVLRGTANTPQDAYFSLQCFQNSPARFTLIISLADFDHDLPSQLTLSVWSDASLSEDVTLPNYKDAAAIGLIGDEVPANIDAESRRFFEILSTAKHTFKYSLLGKTFQYDMTDFPVALERFSRLCNADSKMRE